MELIVALLLVGGIGGTLSIPYMKYKKYVSKMNKLAENNGLKIMGVGLDELFAIISASMDTHRWDHRYGQSKVTLIASGYEQTKNFLIHKQRVAIIEDTVFIISFEEFEKYSAWHDKWVEDGLLVTWHNLYKEEQK